MRRPVEKVVRHQPVRLMQWVLHYRVVRNQLRKPARMLNWLWRVVRRGRAYLHRMRVLLHAERHWRRKLRGKSRGRRKRVHRLVRERARQHLVPHASR